MADCWLAALMVFVSAGSQTTISASQPAGCHAMGPEQRHAIFQPAGAVRYLAEITEAETFLICGEGAMVGRHTLQRAGGETRPEAVLMLTVAEGR